VKLRSKVPNLFSFSDLLVGLVPQLRKDAFPVGEALAAGQAHRHLAMGDLTVVNGVIDR